MKSLKKHLKRDIYIFFGGDLILLGLIATCFFLFVENVVLGYKILAVIASLLVIFVGWRLFTKVCDD